MTLMLRLTRTGAAGALALGVLLGCPATRQEPEGGEGEGEGAGEGEACIEPGDGTFPVKVLVAMDSSGSLQVVDAGKLRLEALQQLLTQVAAQEDTSVAVLGFGASINTAPTQAPTTPAFGTVTEVPAFLGLTDTQTDHEGALRAIEAHLRKDFLATTDEAVRARTRVVVVFVSDGGSSPVCCVEADETTGVLGPIRFGCAAAPFDVAQADTRYCEAEAEQALCNQQDFLTRFRDATPPSADAPDHGIGQTPALAGLEVGEDYNRPATLVEAASAIAALRTEFGVGAIDVTGVVLKNPTIDDGVREIFRLNDCVVEGTMAAITAAAGGGHQVLDTTAPFSLSVDTASLATRACSP
jgi:hypothetical protein